MTDGPSDPSAAEEVPGFWRLQLLGWGALFVAMVAARLDHDAMIAMILRRATYVLLGVLLSLPMRRVLQWLLRRRTNTLALASVSVIAAFGLALVWAAGDSLMREPALLLRLSVRGTGAGIGALLVGTFNNTILLLAWSFLYVAIHRSVALGAARERALRAETLLAITRLRALQYQLSPHMLFNTLNAIATLVLEERLEEANGSLVRLAALLRTSLRAPSLGNVPLADELSFVGQYLELEQVRFGAQLQVTYDIDELALRAAVPVLLLQPLVENAVHHGAPAASGVRTIGLTARTDGARLHLSIGNSTTAGPARAAAREGGLGLANVRERLALTHEGRATMRVRHEATGTFLVELDLPFVHPDAALPSGLPLSPGSRP